MSPALVFDCDGVLADTERDGHLPAFNATFEQVGLPIVEGLAAGCRVVTTTETGIADWLSAHGHRTLSVPTTPQALADALVAALDDQRPPAEIVADLPALDGRLDADRRLFRTGTQLVADEAAPVADAAPARQQRSR